MKRFLIWAVLVSAGVAVPGVWAQEGAPPDSGLAEEALPPAAPGALQAADHPWDHGEGIDLRWSLSPDDPTDVTAYRLYAKSEEDTAFALVGTVPPGVGVFTAERLERGVDYLFRVTAVGPDGLESAPALTPGMIRPMRQWFDGSRFWLAVITFVVCAAVVYWIQHARKGRALNIRKIAGLEAVDEAVGRATEMGRSCLFIPGIQDISDIQTIAGLSILARVSKIAAEFDAKVEVPTSRSLVMTAARETVQASYLAAGRPDAYNEDDIYYVTDEQFGYVAYVQGMMVREKPAACFYMGAFFAESLILAETGNKIGAIQVAGTAMPAQLPFFVAACDYTLIGEEFFAASAYLSGQPEQLGSLKGQDAGKIIVALGIVAGVVFSTAGSIIGADSSVGAWFLDAAAYLRQVILT